MYYRPPLTVHSTHLQSIILPTFLAITIANIPVGGKQHRHEIIAGTIQFMGEGAWLVTVGTCTTTVCKT